MTSEATAGVEVYRTRPQRVEAIYYDGENLDAVVNWLTLINPDCVKVAGDWEYDGETEQQVDCRFADVDTIYGWDELLTRSWVIRFEGDRIDVVEGKEFDHRFTKIGEVTCES